MKYLFQITLIFIIIGCKSDRNDVLLEEKYKRWVGDINFDASQDSKTFTLCNEEYQAYQYFNDSNGLQYEGERLAIYNEFESEYSIHEKGENGLVRIRFIVNCDGLAGRFRILGMDNEYKSKKFKSSITTELMRITKTLDKWKPKKVNGENIDYYQYLIFKLEDGKITEILP